MGLGSKYPVVKPGAQLSLFGIETATGDSSISLAPCTSCGETRGIIVSGVGPHWRGVRCLCGRFRKWLPKPRACTHG
jgi:hypothetical protein